MRSSSAKWLGSGRIGDREIIAVAGAHADGVVGAVRRAVAVRVDDGAAAEQRVEEALRAALRIGGGGVLRAAIVLRQLPDQRAALVVLIGAAALELFEIAHHAVEIAAHLLDLRGDRPALRRQRREQREKSLAGAAGLVRLRDGAVEVGLLLGDGVFGALDLVGVAGIGGALVEASELALQSRTQTGFAGARFEAG